MGSGGAVYWRGENMNQKSAEQLKKASAPINNNPYKDFFNHLKAAAEAAEKAIETYGLVEATKYKDTGKYEKYAAFLFTNLPFIFGYAPFNGVSPYDKIEDTKPDLNPQRYGWTTYKKI